MSYRIISSRVSVVNFVGICSVSWLFGTICNFLDVNLCAVIQYNQKIDGERNSIVLKSARHDKLSKQNGYWVPKFTFTRMTVHFTLCVREEKCLAIFRPYIAIITCWGVHKIIKSVIFKEPKFLYDTGTGRVISIYTRVCKNVLTIPRQKSGDRSSEFFLYRIFLKI